jgi:peptide/nickel transport system permease protein
MLQYIIKRVLFSIPTLLVISLLTFFISINAPGDPVEVMLNRSDESGGHRPQNYAHDKEYEEMRHKLGLDLPLFYFSLTDVTVPDTLYKISKKKYRDFLKYISSEYGSQENVSSYYLAIQNLKRELYFAEKKGNKSECISKAEDILDELLCTYEQDKISSKLNLLVSVFENDGTANLQARQGIFDITKAFDIMAQQKKPYPKYIPVVRWYAFNNQYHHWITNFLTGDFGISYQDKRPVKTVLYGALTKTLPISLLSILLAYLMAIPLGVYSAIKRGSQKEKSITTTLFILYSLPNFWIATMLVLFLCGGDYLSWFPAPGSPPIPEDSSLWYKFSEGLYRLALPLFCCSYGSIAFISRQMRRGLLSSITQDYILTARAKGLNEKKVVWKHAIRNSLLPIITLFASIFPLAISGAFIIEIIFNIPGMGKLSLDALYARDYPLLLAIMMFTSILILIGNLFSDLLYAIVDPRISYAKQEFV